MSNAEWLEGDSPHLEWRISALLDGELTASEENLARAHLERCDHCQQEFAEVAVARAALRDLGEVEPPEGFYDRIEAGLRRPRLGAWVLLTAGLGLLVAVFMSLVLPTPRVRMEPNELVARHEGWSRGPTGMQGAEAAVESGGLLPDTVAGRRLNLVARWGSAWSGRYGTGDRAVSLVVWRGLLEPPEAGRWTVVERRGVAVYVFDAGGGNSVFAARRGGAVYALVGVLEKDEGVRAVMSLHEADELDWTDRVEANLRRVLRRVGL